MAEKRKFQAIKGTRDLLPPETELWNRVEQTAREVFGTYGFGEIRPPIFEPTELFARAVGGETDIVSKEMYTFSENPNWGELEHLRSECGEAYAQSKVTSDAATFVFLVQLFMDKIDSMIRRQELSLTKELQSDRSQISTLLDQFAVGPELGILSALNLKVQLFRFVEFVSMRPEATASVCRAYIEHGMHALPQPVKLYYTGPMFRRERPQKGRYRQFYQIGAEVLEAIQPGQGGAKDICKDAATDAEVIEMLMEFFARLDLQGVQLEINSIGCRECRPKYVEILRAELLKVKDKLGPDSQRRIETNPLRVLDSKLESEQEVIAKLPRISEHLCADCAKQYEEVKRQLGLRGVAYKENWRLVRGLDYYMRTTFEITAKGLGSQNAVCGGGRYDGLVELLGGLPTKGIGFAIGEDRLILSLQEAGKGEVAKGRDVYIAWMGEKTFATAIHAAKILRAAGFRVELPPVERKFGKALGQADRIGSRYALILGENEAASGQWTLKTLADGTQSKFTEAQLLDFLRRSKELSS